MWRRIFFSKGEHFFDLLSRASENNCVAAQKLLEFMRDLHDPSAQARTIKDLEHQGDKITHEIINRLDQTFVTPIDREDIYLLASALDEVIDFVEAVSDRLALFKIEQPTPEAHKLTELIFKAAEEINQAMAMLGQSRSHTIFEHCIEIKRLEEEADQIYREAIAKLFGAEKDLMAVMKWKEIYEFLEEATDKCEDVANVLESIVLKHA